MTYAWSTFRTEVNEWGQVVKQINPGDEVSQSDLDVSDEEWQALHDAGAVSEDPYPDIPTDVSPGEYFRQLAARKLLGEDLEDEEAEALEKYEAWQASKGEPTSAPVTGNETEGGEGAAAPKTDEQREAAAKTATTPTQTGAKAGGANPAPAKPAGSS